MDIRNYIRRGRIEFKREHTDTIDKWGTGEHIFAGAGTVVCWALAAALTPWMIKGSELARFSP